jgi:hypothetical protein
MTTPPRYTVQFISDREGFGFAHSGLIHDTHDANPSPIVIMCDDDLPALVRLVLAELSDLNGVDLFDAFSN